MRFASPLLSSRVPFTVFTVPSGKVMVCDSLLCSGLEPQYRFTGSGLHRWIQGIPLDEFKDAFALRGRDRFQEEYDAKLAMRVLPQPFDFRKPGQNLLDTAAELQTRVLAQVLLKGRFDEFAVTDQVCSRLFPLQIHGTVKVLNQHFHSLLWRR